MSVENNRKTSGRAVISCSGGMDSTSLLVHLLAQGDKVTVLNFNYGSKQNGIEGKRLHECITYLQERGLPVDLVHMDLSAIMGKFYSSLTDESIETPEGHYADENMKITVVPNRNAIFASLIYGYALSIAKREGCDSVKIAMGVHSGDHTIYPDCTPEFFDKLYAAFAQGNWDSEKVELYTPYMDGDKTSILKDCKKCCDALDISFRYVMASTLTCYKPDPVTGVSCGKCGSCTERLEAFANIGERDPVPYEL